MVISAVAIKIIGKFFFGIPFFMKGKYFFQLPFLIIKGEFDFTSILMIIFFTTLMHICYVFKLLVFKFLR